MSHTELSPALLPLLKALADKNRLRIIGLLARRPHAVEELSSSLNIGASTVSHHLSVLGKAGLVTGKTEGYYSIYSLHGAPLEEMAKQLLQPEKVTGVAEGATDDAFEKKVLATFTTVDGKITSFPTQEKKFMVLLRYVLREFQIGVKYTEKQVNTILKKFNDDTATLRRRMVEHGLMAREGGGGKYWRTDSEKV